MLRLLLLILGVGIIVFIVQQVTGKQNPTSLAREHLYKKKQYFFSVNERKFYEVLKLVAQELNLELFAKVRLADVVYSIDKEREWKYGGFSKIKSKHLDFLLCDKKDYSPVVAIELDDSSHLSKSSIGRDEVKNNSLKIADMKLVRFSTHAIYSKEEIKSKLI